MIAVTVIVALISRLVSLGLYPLTDPTEGRYADISRRLAASGDWITPWIDQGVPFWGKPPLSFWMTASSLQLLGDSVFAARLPHFVAGLVILWIIYDLFKRLDLAKAGMFAVAITASSCIFYVSSGTVMTDIPLALGCTLAMRGFWLAVHGPIEHRHRECYLAFIGLAIGLLAKGPVALVLCLIPIGAWTLYTRRLIFVLTSLPWVRGLLLLLVIVLPWYLLAEEKTPGFIEYFIVGEHWQRYLQKGWSGDLYGKGHGRPFGFIWLLALAAMVPWSILLPLLAWWTRRTQREPIQMQHQTMSIYFAFWGLFLLIFFSLSKNVLIAYVLPAVAPLSCLAAVWLARCRAEKIVRRTLVSGVLFTTLFGLGAVGIIALTDEHKKISTEALVAKWTLESKANEPLYFYRWVPQSTKFYTQGTAKLFKTIPEIENAIGSGQALFIALDESEIRAMPEALLAQLSNPEKFGRFTLYEANKPKP